MVNIICGLFFVAFCFTFLFFFQRDYIAFVQHYYSGGRNVIHNSTIPLIITVALSSLPVLLHRYFHLPIRLRAFNWMPSFLLLGFVCSFQMGKFTAGMHSSGYIFFILATLVFGFAYYVALSIQESRSENASLSTFAWPNLLILNIGMMLTCYASNTNESLHHDLCLERAIGEERWDDALQDVAENQNPTRLHTAFCAYALCRKDSLGECFFRFANREGSSAFLPLPKDSLRPWNITASYRDLLGAMPATDMNATDYLEYLAKDTFATSHVPDFLMVSYLLDENLQQFACTLSKYYPPKDTLTHIYDPADCLPRNFAEGLYLYTINTVSPKVCLQDSLMAIDYQEFDSLSSIPTLTVEDRKKACQEKYQSSYWYYLKFVKK